MAKQTVDYKHPRTKMNLALRLDKDLQANPRVVACLHPLEREPPASAKEAEDFRPSSAEEGYIFYLKEPGMVAGTIYVPAFSADVARAFNSEEYEDSITDDARLATIETLDLAFVVFQQEALAAKASLTDDMIKKLGESLARNKEFLFHFYAKTFTICGAFQPKDINP